MYTIEKNIPLPSTRGWVSTIPLDDMAVGDSVLVQIADDEQRARTEKRSVRTRVYIHSRETGTRFTVRTVSGGLRIWRTA